MPLGVPRRIDPLAGENYRIQEIGHSNLLSAAQHGGGVLAYCVGNRSSRFSVVANSRQVRPSSRLASKRHSGPSSSDSPPRTGAQSGALLFEIRVVGDLDAFLLSFTGFLR